jgi:hypothetical protein
MPDARSSGSAANSEDRFLERLEAERAAAFERSFDGWSTTASTNRQVAPAASGATVTTVLDAATQSKPDRVPGRLAQNDVQGVAAELLTWAKKELK